ncbi:hypothetical protein Tco_0335037 [Tanacetum coccineum]
MTLTSSTIHHPGKANVVADALSPLENLCGKRLSQILTPSVPIRRNYGISIVGGDIFRQEIVKTAWYTDFYLSDRDSVVVNVLVLKGIQKAWELGPLIKTIADMLKALLWKEQVSWDEDLLTW